MLQVRIQHTADVAGQEVILRGILPGILREHLGGTDDDAVDVISRQCKPSELPTSLDFLIEVHACDWPNHQSTIAAGAMQLVRDAVGHRFDWLNFGVVASNASGANAYAGHKASPLPEPAGFHHS